MTMTTKESAPANGNGSTPDAHATAPGIDTDTLREIAAAEQATGTAGTDTGTAPMSAVPEPVAVQQTTISPPPREPGLDEPEQHNAGDRETIPDPEHVPGTTNPRTTRKIVYGVIAAAVIAALLVFGRLFSGTAADAEQAQAPVVTPPVNQPVAQAAATVVPKDTDATECATMGVSTDTFRPGWCTGRAPGAYLLADDTMAYCSCAKPRKAAPSGK
jgi:hypothetical protein